MSTRFMCSKNVFVTKIHSELNPTGVQSCGTVTEIAQFLTTHKECIKTDTDNIPLFPEP